MATIPQKELRNNIGEVLRRAEAGEELTITVSGRPVARLTPLPMGADRTVIASFARQSRWRSLAPEA
jgi:prevent-host-death family protein